MKDRFHQLALQAGGSHFPGVGGENLERFAHLLLEECFSILRDQRNHNNCVKTTFDRSQAICVVEQTIAAVCKNFNVTETYGANSERIVG